MTPTFHNGHDPDNPQADGLLAGNVAIITGTSRGIGQAIAAAFLAQGAEVIGCGRSADHVMASDRYSYIQADVISESGTGDVVQEALNQFGRIDILVNNAGTRDNTPVEQITQEQIHHTMSTNFSAAALLTKAVLPHMVEQRAGSIINISSRLARIGFPNTSIYGASKAALESFTRATAIDYGKYGIRINAIAPGMAHTKMIDQWFAQQDDPEQAHEQQSHAVPLRRLAREEDIAHAAVFLGSDWSSYITGITLPVDGGYTAQ